MTDDKLIELARKAGINAESDTLCRYEGWVGPLKQFAALVLANNPPQSFMSWQEGYEAGRLAERERLQAFMRQMFDAYSLSSDPGGLKNRGNK